MKRRRSSSRSEGKNKNENRKVDCIIHLWKTFHHFSDNKAGVGSGMAFKPWILNEDEAEK